MQTSTIFKKISSFLFLLFQLTFVFSQKISIPTGSYINQTASRNVEVSYSPNYLTEVDLEFDENAQNNVLKPVVNGGLDVASGVATYSMGIDVLPGVNNFTPTINLSYSNQSGGGNAGYGWSLSGTSSITKGYKTKEVDGYIGNVDEEVYYLDGARLINKPGGAAGEYVTYNHTNLLVKFANNVFTVYYPNGQESIYRMFVGGNYLLTQVKDFAGNIIHYTYFVDKNAIYLDKIDYGNVTLTSASGITLVTKSDVTVKILYTPKAKTTESNFGQKVVVDKMVSGVTVKDNNANIVYRTYTFVHDITSTGENRLRKILLKNQAGEEARPVVFYYRDIYGLDLVKNKTSEKLISSPSDIREIQNVVTGDFDGDGNTETNYFVKDGSGNTIIHNPEKSNTSLTSYQIQDYTFSAPILLDGVLTKEDKIIGMRVDPSKDTYSSGTYKMINETMVVSFSDQNVNKIKESTLILNGSVQEYCYELEGAQMFDHSRHRNELKRGNAFRNIQQGDFNGDGLLDLLIFQESHAYTVGVGNYYDQDVTCPDFSKIKQTTTQVYFVEIAKNAGQASIQPTFVTNLVGTSLDKNLGNYILTLANTNKDAQQEILAIKKGDNASATVLRIDFKNKKIVADTAKSLGVKINDELNPIVEDFNGDGLTDLLVPRKSYSIGVTADQHVNAHVSPENLTADNFQWDLVTTTVNGTSTVFTKSSPIFSPDVKLKSFRSGTFGTAYLESSLFPMDVNADGRVDLVAINLVGTRSGENANLKANTYALKNNLPSTDNHHNKLIIYENMGIGDNGLQFRRHTHTDFNITESFSPYVELSSNQDHKSINTFRDELVLTDIITKNQIKFKFLREGGETLLTKVDNNSGSVQTLEYTPFSDKIKDYSNSKGVLEKPNLYYQLTQEAKAQKYPFSVLNYQEGVQLVAKLHNTFKIEQNGAMVEKTATKEYRYQDAYVKLDGKGLLGFHVQKESTPYLSKWVGGKSEMVPDPEKPVLWTVSTGDLNFDNAVKTTTYGSIDGKTPITYSENVYEKFTGGRNKVLVTKQISKNYLSSKTNPIVETISYQYNNYLDVTKTTIEKAGLKEIVQEKEYAYNFNKELGTKYWGGVVTRNYKKVTLLADGTSESSLETAKVNPNGTLLSKTTYGNFPTYTATTPGVTTTFAYHSFGPVKSSTITYISSADLDSPKGPQISLTQTFDYDISKRFVTKATSADGSFTLAQGFDITGKPKTQTTSLNPFTTKDETIENTFNAWGLPTQTKDLSTGAISYVTPTPYGNNGYVKIISYNSLLPNNKSYTITNNLGQTIESGGVDVKGRNLVSKVEYDIYGRKTKSYDVHFAGSTPTTYNTYKYDALDNVVQEDYYVNNVLVNSAKGTTDGLKATATSGNKKEINLYNALGELISHTDQGGTITYKYYPDGKVKETNFEGSITKFEYDPWGNRTVIDDPSAGKYQSTYNIAGQLLRSISPNDIAAGTYGTKYVYDRFGKVRYQISEGKGDPNLSESKTYKAIKYLYNETYGFSTQVIATNKPFVNGFAFDKIENILVSNTLYNAYDKYFNFNFKVENTLETTFGRVTKTTEDTPEYLYTKDFTYDALGRLASQTKTTQVKVAGVLSGTIKTVVTNTMEYNDAFTGGLVAQYHKKNNGQLVKIWEIKETNLKGQATQINFGNGFTQTNTYDDFFAHKSQKVANAGGVVAMNFEYEVDVVKGWVKRKDDLVFGRDQTFKQDELERLIEEKVNGVVTQSYAYDPKGRMTYNSEVGVYNYNQQSYQLQSINSQPQANGKSAIENRGGSHQINYNSDKQATFIVLDGVQERIDFSYNPLAGRATAYFSKNGVGYKEKVYTSDFAVEITKTDKVTGDNKTFNTYKIQTFVDGEAYSSAYLNEVTFTKNATTPVEKNYYLHRDYQGTIVAITSEDSKLVEQRAFDPWGNVIEVRHYASDGITYTKDKTLGITDRGYTGHEHLQSVGLIHMNGRLYDPLLRRFLMPDNFVQDSSNSQNYNRYSYVMNNPLMYTDPSGEKFKDWLNKSIKNVAKVVLAACVVAAGIILLATPGAGLAGLVILEGGKFVGLTIGGQILASTAISCLGVITGALDQISGKAEVDADDFKGETETPPSSGGGSSSSDGGSTTSGGSIGGGSSNSGGSNVMYDFNKGAYVANTIEDAIIFTQSTGKLSRYGEYEIVIGQNGFAEYNHMDIGISYNGSKSYYFDGKKYMGSVCYLYSVGGQELYYDALKSNPQLEQQKYYLEQNLKNINASIAQAATAGGQARGQASSFDQARSDFYEGVDKTFAANGLLMEYGHKFSDGAKFFKYAGGTIGILGLVASYYNKKFDEDGFTTSDQVSLYTTAGLTIVTLFAGSSTIGVAVGLYLVADGIADLKFGTSITDFVSDMAVGRYQNPDYFCLTCSEVGF
ncbi:MAG: hypothetical protein C4K58_04375 [Flavobacteriaceae bacterium]|nr:MAG: hypothetical protein C4K58_04375 [Flavobacteriaceae bacterium]